MKPMLIAQISDTHLAGWDKKTFGIAPMAENLARCVNHINQFKPRPDLVLVSGDISNDGRKEELEQAAALLGELHIPYFVIPGNHDERALMTAAFSREVCPTESEEFIHYAIEGYDLRLIAVDSTVPGAPGGELCEVRAAWLDDKLCQANNQPTILFMHHPPVKFGVMETDIDGFIGADRLGDIVAKHSNVVRILAGHIHLSSLTQWRGIVVSTAPSTGMRLFLDLTLERSAYILDEPCYQLHYWTPERHLVTHTIRVLASEELHPFEETS
ncbi:MAG: phosphodiesterase [Chloroflexi bacterium]|nr:phosphodiesterase [Chloroflexota bacterium]